MCLSIFLSTYLSIWLGNMLRATTACTVSASDLPKWRAYDVLCTFWRGHALRTASAFFNLHPSKSGPKLSCFFTFWLGHVLRATVACTFRHSSLQKWSVMFLTFWLWNVLRAIAACNFSTPELPKVVRTWCVFYILAWKCASRREGVQLLISHLATWLRTRRFSKCTFRPSQPRNH